MPPRGSGITRSFRIKPEILFLFVGHPVETQCPQVAILIQGESAAIIGQIVGILFDVAPCVPLQFVIRTSGQDCRVFRLHVPIGYVKAFDEILRDVDAPRIGQQQRDILDFGIGGHGRLLPGQ